MSIRICLHWAFPRHRRLCAAVIVAICAVPQLALSQGAQAPRTDLAEVSLEELGNLEVTSVSRKAQRLNDTAAAVFVITNEDIRRSGATSIPDALRMVPGVQVGRIGTDRWAVSARGFAGLYSNKLLVQVDGRSIYSQLFSGVHWDAQDVVLEDIERIEVIRGPGAALWGANAVNGVINVITRKARDTQGGLVQVGAGTQEKGSATLRYGGEAGDDTQYRVYAKGYARSEAVDMNGTGAGDGSRSQHAGFRLDRRIGAGSRLMVTGDSYEAHQSQTFLQPSLLPPFSTVASMANRSRGMHLLARYDHTLQDESEATLQVYVASTLSESSPFISEQRDTYDLDFQHRVRLGSRHDFIWGLNYRLSRDQITTPTSYEQISEARGDFQIASIFVHDEIALVPDRLRLIAGAKLEHNSYTGTEPQPNVRLLWTPDPSHAVWAAWSRAVRTPSRSERQLSLDIFVLPPFDVASGNPTPFPLLVRSGPQPGVELSSEKLASFEIGYRAQPGPRLAVDLTAFANHYTELRAGILGPATLQFAPFPYVQQITYADNGLSAHTRGLEASLDWRPLDRWRLQASYTQLHMSLPTADPDILRNQVARDLSGSAPQSQFSLRSMLDLAPAHQLDLWVRHVSRVAFGDIPAYTTLDARYGWRPKKNFDLSLIGQNLLKDRHPESRVEVVTAPLLQVQRGVFLRATWRY